MSNIIKTISILVCLSLSTPAFSSSLNTNTMIGKASWYTTSGKRTASGLRHRYSVAHRWLPFGSQLRVTNISNGRQIIAVVNDRGPFIKNRLIDVSKSVADFLGFTHKGITTLKIDILR